MAIYSEFQQCYLFNCIGPDKKFACTFQENVYHSTFVKLSQVLEYYGGGESAQSLRNDSISETHDVHYKANTEGECERLDWTCDDKDRFGRISVRMK